MRNISIFIVLMFASALCREAMAQSVDEVVERLAQRNMDGVHVQVTDDASTRAAVEAVESQRRAIQVSGFRVVIFSANGQYAGDNAERVLKEFETAFPHINAYLVYESPYFKISVGDCLSMEEAQILMAEVSSMYPKAFPKREDIKLERLCDTRRKDVEMRDSVVIESLSPMVTKF